MIKENDDKDAEIARLGEVIKQLKIRIENGRDLELEARYAALNEKSQQLEKSILSLKSQISNYQRRLSTSEVEVSTWKSKHAALEIEHQKCSVLRCEHESMLALKGDLALEIRELRQRIVQLEADLEKGLDVETNAQYLDLLQENG